MSTVKKDGIGYWIKVALWLLLSFSGWFLPSVDPITPFGMKIVGIFVGLMFGWICLDLTYPSFSSVVLVALAAGASASDYFYAGFGSDIVVTIIILTTFCIYATKVGLDDYIAQRFIRIKFLQGRPWLFLTFLMVLIYLLGIVVGIYLAIFTLWPIMYRICDEAGFQRGGKFSSYLCFAAPFIAGLGQNTDPFNPWSLVGMSALNSCMGEDFVMNYFLYTVYMIIISLVIIAAYLLLGKIIRLDLSPLKNYRVEGKMSPLSHDQKICLGFFIAFFIVMYMSSILPDDWALTSLVSNLGTIGLGALLLCVLGVSRSKGAKLCDVIKLAEEGVPWMIVFLMVATTIIGAAIQNEEAGIIAWINVVFEPIVSNLSPLMLYLVLIYAILTQFVHNLVLLSSLSPVAVTFGTLVGANPYTIAFIGIVILSAALATAAASSRSGLVFANTEWIAPKWAYFLGITSVVLVMAFYACIGVPLSTIMFPV